MLDAIANLDTSFYLRLIRLQKSPTLVALFRFISRTGDGYLYAALAVALYLLELGPYLLFIKAGLLAFLIELPCFMLLKAKIQRDRPCDRISNSSTIIKPSDKFSMPSGHTSAAFLMAVLISYFYVQFAVLVSLWAALIGLSRIVLGVHYPSDILAGAALGSCCTLIAIALLL